jgi:uncharacterized membrane protein
MDATRGSVLQSSRPLVSWWTLATISLAALAALAFFLRVALPYLLLDPVALKRYEPERVWLLVHIGAGGVALLTGPIQLWLGVKGRTARVHRRLGLTYVTAIAFGSVAAFYLAAHTTLGWGFAAGITGLAIAWVVTTSLAVVAVRRGLIEQHRQWMIRSYTVTFAFVTFRAAWTVLQMADVGTRAEQLAMSSWFCWAVPLLIVETVMHGRGIFAERGTHAAVFDERPTRSVVYE